MQITFLGATQTVAVSKSLLSLGSHKVLIDCGLFQSLKELRLRNWNPFPIQPQDIHAVILTHAHIDHYGYDCGHLLEEANYANRHGFLKCLPAPARALKNKIEERFGWQCELSQYQQSFNL